ncbi:hypothetical protein O3P69_015390 [Scylla paramamosain]|uniref:G-protein coupled receptors family 1 profile domain-containing protein n=1 Tax=Scylla paramamosain TaxID=85552 RepID=A0AAW0T4U5_SCYPA
MMSGGGNDWAQHLPLLEKYLPRESLLSILPNVSQENLELFVSLMRNDTGGDVGASVPPPLLTDHAACDVGFRDGYKEVHGYLALMICLLGAFTNVLNMVILTRREMINSTNTILTGLAVADFLLLLEYSFYAASYIKGQDSMFDSYVHSVFILFHAHYTQVTHTVAICLTITLAVWRYIAICKPHLNLVLCTLPRARLAVFIAYVISPILSVPNYLVYSIHQYSDEYNNASLYHVDFSERSKAYDSLLQRINFWFHSVLIKIIPCLLLTVLIYHIIRAMYIAKRRKPVTTAAPCLPESSHVQSQAPRTPPSHQRHTLNTSITPSPLRPYTLTSTVTPSPVPSNHRLTFPSTLNISVTPPSLVTTLGGSAEDHPSPPKDGRILGSVTQTRGIVNTAEGDYLRRKPADRDRHLHGRRHY